MTNYVLVLDQDKKPLMPCHPARARELLGKGRAAVFRRYPFTIILKDRRGGDTQPVHLKIDPGSKTTGVALVIDGLRGLKAVYGLNVVHRGQVIRDGLQSRAMLRRSRRQRKTRYRKPRFLNRRKAKGWLAPSIQHRIDTTLTWVRRLMLSTPVSEVYVETVSFDTQKLQNPDIKGREYQQGTLAGYEVKEYLLYRYNHTCQYCSGVSKDKILEMEHITPRRNGGSNRVSNLTLSCRICNQDKGALSLTEWYRRLSVKSDTLSLARCRGIKRVESGIKPSLKDAAAASAANAKLIRTIGEIGLPVQTAPGYQTKYNRHRHDYRKDHWIDAVCVGDVDRVYLPKDLSCLTAKAMGHGNRRMVQPDRNGFPNSKPRNRSTVYGFRTGDIVTAIVPSGKYAGHHVGRVSVRSSGKFAVSKISVHHKHITLLQKKDGYQYTYGTIRKETFIAESNYVEENKNKRVKRLETTGISGLFESTEKYRWW